MVLHVKTNYVIEKILKYPLTIASSQENLTSSWKLQNKTSQMPGMVILQAEQAKFDDNKAYVPQEEEGKAFVGTSSLASM